MKPNFCPNCGKSDPIPTKSKDYYLGQAFFCQSCKNGFYTNYSYIDEDEIEDLEEENKC